MAVYTDYTQSNARSIIRQRDAARKELKAEIEKAIPDEAGAQKMYSKMTSLALNAGMNDYAIEIDLIRGQENNHEMIFRNMLKEILNTIT